MVNLSSRTARSIKIAISLALFAGLFYFLDTDKLRQSFQDIDGSCILLALIMVLLNRVLMPVKWNMLLRARGIRISNFAAVRIYTISSFLGLVLPPTVGADSVRSYYLKRAGCRLSDVVASIAIERVLGFLVLLVFTIAGFILLVDLLRGDAINGTAFVGLLAVVSLIALSAVYLSFTPQFQSVVFKIVNNIAGRTKNVRLHNLARGADKFVQAYQDYRHKEQALVIFCCLTSLELTLVIVRSYVVALAFGVELSLMAYFAFLPLVTLLSRMPVSFDGFGITETLFVYFLGLFAVSPETGFLIGFVNHILFIVGVLPGGLFYMFSKPVNARNEA